MLAVAALLAFVLAFEPLGYLLTMVPLLMATAYLCGCRNGWRNLLVAVAASLVCLAALRYGLDTVLPEGVLGVDALI